MNEKKSCIKCDCKSKISYYPFLIPILKIRLKFLAIKYKSSSTLTQSSKKIENLFRQQEQLLKKDKQYKVGDESISTAVRL